MAALVVVARWPVAATALISVATLWSVAAAATALIIVAWLSCVAVLRWPVTLVVVVAT